MCQRRRNSWFQSDLGGSASGCRANFFRGRGTRIVRRSLRRNNLLSERKKDLCHFANRFVTHGAEDHNERAIFKILRQRRTQRPGAGGIMGNIKDVSRAIELGLKYLEAAGPARFAHAALYSIGVVGVTYLTFVYVLKTPLVTGPLGF